MKVALVHDYLREYGGAERVLRVLADLFPQAPIYCAFRIRGSSADKQFQNRQIIESPWAPVIKHGNLYSPLRFLIPFIWGGLDLSEFDLVITSCSSYLARGFKVSPPSPASRRATVGRRPQTKIIAYCHTPPKYLYGYETSVNWQRHWPIRIYGTIINHFLRIFDFESAQRVDYWIANSKNVAQRIAKHYRKPATVIYPPVEAESLIKNSWGTKKKDFFLIASRLVGGKGLEAAALAANQLGFKLKVAGEAAGWAKIEEKIGALGGKNVELLGRVSDKELYQLYAEAKGFLALEKDVDFGMTAVEAMAAGTPVIAYNGGGFRETVVDGATGILVNDTNLGTIKEALKRLAAISWKRKEMQRWARNFGKEEFVKKIKKFIESFSDIPVFS